MEYSYVSRSKSWSRLNRRSLDENKTSRDTSNCNVAIGNLHVFSTNDSFWFHLIYVLVYDFSKSPQSLASFHLYGSIAHKTYFTNSGINFFLYVMSGRKLRTDLVNLFKCKRRNFDSNFTTAADRTKNTDLSITTDQS